jgi:hypothetical protein
MKRTDGDDRGKWRRRSEDEHKVLTEKKALIDPLRRWSKEGDKKERKGNRKRVKDRR